MEFHSSESSGAPGSGQNEREPTSVLGRTFRILDTFSADRREQTLSEISQRSGIPKATAHRLVGSLERWGALERRGRHYRCGTRLFELGNLVAHRELREVALPFLEDLFETLHDPVQLAVLEDVETLYIEKISGHRQVPAPTRVAGRMPVHCTAVGKAMLAFSPAQLVDRVIALGLPAATSHTLTHEMAFRDELTVIRERGIAIDREESRLGVSCVAAPIFHTRGQTIAGALSVMAPTARLDLPAVSAAVRIAAHSITRRLVETNPN